MNRILVVAAHPDDEVLGLGGTIRKRVDSGAVADCLILGEGMMSRMQEGEAADRSQLEKLRENALESAGIIGYAGVYFTDFPDNRFDSVALLDIVQTVQKYVEGMKPDIVYTHHYGDLNIDHRITFEAVITACRPVGDYSVKEIYCFETPSSTEWNFKYEDGLFKPNVFVDIQDTLKHKLSAMECYKTELRTYPHPRSLKGLEIIAQRWGSAIGKQYVEAFELIRKTE